MPILTCRDDEQRVLALRALDILDTPAEETFDRFARLAAGLFEAPVARVSLIDADREFLKATFGCEMGSIARGASFCTWTVAQDMPLIVPDLTQDPRFAANGRVVGPPHYRFYAGAPLKNREGHNLGAICCLDGRPRHPTPLQVSLLQDLAQMVVEAMELRLVATTDSLTGLMTRRAFTDAARRDIRLAHRNDRPLACCIFDLDHFKAVNDGHGHAAGDEVLRRIGAICRRHLRDSDYCGRLGGEEFAVLMRDTTIASAYEVAERLRTAIAAESFGQPFTDRTASWHVTASFGVSRLQKGDTPFGLVSAADVALYAAKDQGRNRTLTSQTDTIAPPPVRSPRPHLRAVS